MIVWLVIGEEYSRQDGFLERYWIEDAFYTNIEAQQFRDSLNDYKDKFNNIKYRLDSIEVKHGQEELGDRTIKKYEHKGALPPSKHRI